MNMKFFFISLIAFCNTMYSQENLSDSSCFSNDKIRYEVIIKNNRNIREKDTLHGLFVLIHLSQELENNLKKKDKNFWVSKLTNDSSDWAANLLLYYLYNKNAITIAYINGDRQKWLQLKNIEIKYWEEYLSKLKP